VPRDDESHYTFRVNLVTMPAEEAKKYIAERPENYSDRSMVRHYGEAVLAGELRIQDITDRTHIEFVQDYVAQVGQGSIENRKLEHLGRSDVIVALLRKLWKREMTALAEGRPLKQWRLTDKIEPAPGI
jgi:5,5'-dehydrodivanillate O-demethylase